MPRRPPMFRGAQVGRGAEVAWEAALSIVLGAILGIWLDGRFGTSPLLLVVFVSLGLTVAVRQLLRFARKQTAADAEAARERAARKEQETPPDRDLE